MLRRRIQRLFATQGNRTNYVKKTLSVMLLFSVGVTTTTYAWMHMDGDRVVHLQAKDLPLSTLVVQAEAACPGIADKIKLRQPELKVTVNFANVDCKEVPAIFGDMEERFGMRFTDVQFSAALDIFKQQCPVVFRDVKLKNPNALYSIQRMDVSCLDILAAVAEFDAKN